MARKKAGSVAEPVAAQTGMTDELFDKLQKEILGDLVTEIPDRTKNIFKLHVPSMNHALSGGLPRGQMIHVYGPEGSGKSTFAQQCAASIIAQGGRVWYIDPENSIHQPYALALNVDPKRFLYTNKIPNGEVILDKMEAAIRANMFDLIVVDTVATLAPASVLADSNEQHHVADQARMFSQALMKLNNAAVNSDAIIMWVNQLRANIQMGYGVKPTKPAGGEALKFYCNINVGLKRWHSIKDGEQIIGQEVHMIPEKNKIGPPMREAKAYLIYGKGFCRDYDLLLAAKDSGVIDTKGSWYEYNGTKLGQGLDGMRAYAAEHPEFLDTLEKELYAGEVPAVVEPKEEEEKEDA